MQQYILLLFHEQKSIMSHIGPAVSDVKVKNFYKSFYFIDLNPIIEENSSNPGNMALLEDLIR